MYSSPQVITVSSSIDAETSHISSNEPHQSHSHTLNQVDTEPPPSYDEVVLDIRLASPNPNTAIIY